ncbi:uncharacterized protein [Hemitrygon akajei]|uniref:uncharacterized protein isoform X1 n=1 Tax=Hemitrygon akajei TaxID=2704970 RepID=UPI003BF949EA
MDPCGFRAGILQGRHWSVSSSLHAEICASQENVGKLVGRWIGVDRRSATPLSDNEASQHRGTKLVPQPEPPLESARSPCDCVGFLWVIWFSPTSQRYEKSKDQENKTKRLQVALERAGRRDLADKLQCLHWGHQNLSSRVELPSAFPFLITVHKTINNRQGLQRINQLSHR